MPVTLNLDPETEKNLTARAQEQGLSLREYVERLIGREAGSSENPPAASEPPIWELVTERMKKLPPEVFEHLPADGASEHDHYLYGWPKRNQ